MCRFEIKPKQILPNANIMEHQVELVGGFNPFEKYIGQTGSSPQVRVKIKNVWNHHLGNIGKISKTASLTLLRFFFREKHQMISWIPPNLNIAAHSVRWVVCINQCWWRFPETNELPLKMMLGRVSSFWGGLFSGALAVSFQGVIHQSCWSSSVRHTANTELLTKRN